MDKVYKLSHEFEHLLDMDFDASSDFFSGIETVEYDMMDIVPFKMPEQIYFRANLNVIPNNTDYPITDLTFPIMSKKMIEIINNIKKINCNYLQTIMIDDRFLNNYLDDNGNLVEDVLFYTSFLGIQFLEFENIFDYNSSDFRPLRSNPDLPGVIKKMVLKKPENGFPPLFKIKESMSILFISHATKESLEKNNIKGCVFEEVEVSQN